MVRLYLVTCSSIFSNTVQLYLVTCSSIFSNMVHLHSLAGTCNVCPEISIYYSTTIHANL